MKSRIVILILLIPNMLFSSSGADFLKIEIGPRAIGMGSAHVAVCDDVTSTFWNPAGLTRIRSTEILLSHQNWYFDSRYEYLGYADRFDFGNIGFYSGYFSLPGFQEIGEFGENLGSINIFDLMVGGCYSRYFHGIAVGAGTKYIYRHLDDESGNGLAFDLGFQKGFNFLKYFKSANYNFQAGVLLNNVGTDIHFSTCQENLPSSIKLGIKYIPYSSRLGTLIFASDFEKYFYEDQELNLGFEYNFKKIIYARAGLKYSDGRMRPTFSGGTVAKFGSMDLDFSLSYFNVRQDSIVATSLIIRNRNSKTLFITEPPAPEKKEPEKKDKLTVAVLDFRNLTGDEKFDYLSATAAETISTYIASSGIFYVKEKRQFNEMLQTMGDSPSTTDLSGAGGKYGLDAIVTGSFFYHDDLIRINIKVVDVKSSDIMAASYRDGRLGRGIFRLMDETAKDVIEQLERIK